MVGNGAGDQLWPPADTSACSASTIVAVASECAKPRRARVRPTWCVELGLIVAFMVKTGFETITGSAVFADSARGGFVPVPLAHLVGFLVGALTSLAAAFTPNRFRMQSSPPPLRWPAI